MTTLTDDQSREGWREAAMKTDITTMEWDDCSVGFFCACGEKLSVEECDGVVTCGGCGKQYKLISLLAVRKAANE